MLFSDYYNKDILAINSAKFLGIIKGIYIDINTKKPKALAVQDKYNLFLLPFSKIIGNNHKVTVLTETSLQSDNEQNQQQLFYIDHYTVAYTHEGKQLGNFIDVNISGEKLIWFDKPYLTKNVSAMYDKTLIINLGNKRSKKPSISPESPEPLAIDTTTTSDPLQVSPYIPAEKEVSDYSFLQGRIVIRDIIDASCGVNIKKGTVINSSIIELARKSGNLVFLALSSLLD